MKKTTRKGFAEIFEYKFIKKGKMSIIKKSIERSYFGF